MESLLQSTARGGSLSHSHAEVFRLRSSLGAKPWRCLRGSRH